jgi:predicted YcjX-like family ATPase
MTIDRRVGVVGLYHAGKTVFLTSLINHLQDHDPRLCPIDGGDVRLEAFREAPAGEQFEPFAYRHYRQFLVEKHAWPQKTRAVAEYACEFKKLRGRGREDVRLRFLDIPGERLADMFMAERDYGQWSDQVLRFLEVRPEYRRHAADYIAALGADKADAQKLLYSYRLLLASLIFDYKPIVTPSTFIVDVNGGYPDRESRTVKKLAAARHCGIGAGGQFAPLSADARGRWPKLAAQFARHYEAYREKVYQPIAGWLRKCDLLLVLIDVTTILASGLGMYEGNRELLEHLFRAAEPGKSSLARLMDWVSGGLWRNALRAVERVAFIASKADKVLPEDRQRMQGLLENMTRKLVSGIEGLRVRWQVCAGVDSTEDCGNGKLEGVLLRAKRLWGKPAPEAFSPSRVPDYWPENWRAGEYAFPDVRPQIPARRDAVPKHIALHHVVSFILER